MLEKSYIVEMEENGRIQLPEEILKEWGHSLTSTSRVVFYHQDETDEWNLILCEDEEP